MKGGKGLSDRDKIVGIVIMSVLTVIASITCGFVLNKQADDVPEIEIIEVIDGREDKTSAVSAAVETVRTYVTAETSAEQSESGGLVNINTASAEELMELKGIGEKTAAAIIEYREGAPFQRIEDIMNVKGIGEKKFEDLKDHICI